MEQSRKYSLNKTDLKKWARNGLIFCTPALLVLLASISESLPGWFPDQSAEAAIIIFVGERIIDLVRKFLQGTK